MSENTTNWLSDEEAETWLNVWSFYSGMPTRLDAQLKRDAGISHYDFFAMQTMSRAENGCLRMSELAALAEMSLSHLSRVITRLEKKELVRRIPDPNDGRSTLVELTDAGWDLIREVAPGHINEVRKLVFDNLTPEENRQVGAAMKKIVEAMNLGGLAR